VHVQNSVVSSAVEEVAEKKRRGVRGLGSIYEYKGVWHYSIPQAGYPPIVRSSKKWTSRTQANAAREADLRERNKGTAQRPKGARGRSLSEFALHYLEANVRPQYDPRTGERIGGLEPTTYTTQEVLVRLYIEPYFRVVDLDQVTTVDIQAWQDKLAKEQRSVIQRNKAHILLGAIFNFAIACKRETGVDYNPVQLVKGPSYRARKVEPLSSADTTRVLGAFRGHFLEALVHTTLTLGLRRQEVLPLQWQHIDLERKTILIALRGGRAPDLDKERLVQPRGRNKKPRRGQPTKLQIRSGVKMRADDADLLPLPEALVSVLQQHRTRVLAYRLRQGKRWTGPADPLAPEAFVFPHASGGMLSPEYLNERYRTLVLRAGVSNTKLHTLRHTCASYLLAAGEPLWKVSKILRHANINVTADIYGHLLPEQHRETINVMGNLVAGLVG